MAELLSEFTLQELRDLFRQSPSKEARKVAAPALNRMASNERLVGSVLTELSSRLFLLQGAGIQQVTAQNEIDFARMGQDSIALFFSVPDGEMQRLRSQALVAESVSPLALAAWENHSPNTNETAPTSSPAIWDREFVA